LGTRNAAVDGRPYEWKTFRNVYDLTDKFARGISALNLCPNIKGEGIDWNFMGIFSKNREEWAIIDFACLRSDITIVPFYDSLGKEALSLVLNSTEVTTMCIERNTLEVLIKLKETECKYL
jgi:long-subunit acyl-CoA synthetase (AMP-forming)